jgi:type VI secretion system protein ImpL
MIAYIFTAIFMSLLWAVVIALDLPWVIAIAPTAAVVGTVGVLLGIRKWKDRQAARALEKSLVDQGEAQARSARPDQQGEIQAMQEEFAKAVASLKTSKLARGGSDALSVLPWYVIIGPPGAGKSTALRASGLQFPYLSARGGGVRGVGGTRNCEWWLTNEAVILDTAGRYTTEDDDRDEWFSFLDGLAKHRARKPINGLIVAVSVGDLLDGDEGSSGALGRKLRERVDEVMSRLKVIVPVYVLFTKCDLIPGFVETFGDLNKADRSQIWGFTAPLVKAASVSGLFQERFDELAGLLEKRSLKRLAQERRPQAREKVYQFPLQYASLRQNLTELIQNLFLENVYQDTPVMRGVYFTSGTQEGRPIDRMMRAVAEGFGIKRSLGSGSEPVIDVKSYFLGEVFTQVMFKDQSVAVRSTKESKRQNVLQYVYAGAAALAAVLVLLFPTMSFFKNRELAKSTRERIEAVALDKASATDSAWLASLKPLRERVEQLTTWERDGAPLSMGFGMYQGSGLLQHARTYYAAAVGKAMVAPVFSQDMDEMDAFARAQEGSDGGEVREEHVLFYERLKLHLLLSGPKAEQEPAVTEADRQWVAQEILGRWTAALEGEASPEMLSELEANAKLYALVATEAALLRSRNEPLVKRMRASLARLPWEKFQLEKLVSDVSDTVPELTLKGVLGGSAPSLKSAGRVRGAFTKKGWEEVVKERLAKPEENSEAWVLETQGATGPAAEKQIRRLRSAYFQAYAQEWQSFLESIRVELPSGNAEALTMLEDLTRGKTTPIARIFQLVATNVRLASDLENALKGVATTKLKAGLDKLIAKGKDVAAKVVPAGDDSDMTSKDLEAQFSGFIRFGVAAAKSADGDADALPLDVYREQLEFIRDALRADMENPDDHAPLMTKLQTARIRVKSLIQSQDVGWRPRLEAILWPPLEGASKSSASEAASLAAQRWCSAVVTPFENNLAKLYPFNSSSVQDVALADLSDFYKPGSGTLWGYFAEALKADVVAVGTQFKWSGRFGGASKAIYNDQLLRFLERSQEISNSLFARGASEVGTTFSVLIHPAPKVASITLTVNGKSVEYRNGLETLQTFVWPGEGKEKGARLVVKTNKGEREEYVGTGEWGLFKLLEQAQLSPPSGGSRAFNARWKMRSLDTEVNIVFEPQRDSPFYGRTTGGEKGGFLQLFRGPNVKAPRSIGRNSEGCEGS